MSRLFRDRVPGPAGYPALLLFIIAYLGAVGLIVAPQDMFSIRATTATDPRFP